MSNAPNPDDENYLEHLGSMSEKELFLYGFAAFKDTMKLIQLHMSNESGVHIGPEKMRDLSSRIFEATGGLSFYAMKRFGKE